MKNIQNIKQQIIEWGSQRLEKLIYQVQTQQNCEEPKSIQSFQKIDQNHICIATKSFFQIWNLSQRKLIQTVNQENSGCILVFNKKYIVSAYLENVILLPLKLNDNVIKIEENQQNQLAGHEEMIYSIKQFDETRLLTGSFDMTIRCWDLSGKVKKTIQIFKGHDSKIFYNNIICFPDDDQFISMDCSGQIQIWDINQEESLNTMQLLPPENAYKPKVEQQEIEEDQPEYENEQNEDDSNQCLLLKMNDNIFITSYNNTVQVWDRQSQSQISDTSFILHKELFINELHRVNSDCILSMGEDKLIKVWKFTNQFKNISLIDTFQGKNEIFSGILLSNQYFASGDKDGCIDVWNAGISFQK